METRMIRVTCPYCKSSGYIAPPPAQTILMGPCPVCGEPVALCNSKVIGLKDTILGKGDFPEKIQSLAQTIMEFVNTQSGSVDEKGLEQLIRQAEDRAGDVGDDSENEPELEVAPSIRHPDTEPITAEEAEDFLRIDLNLLGKKDYFEKHFG